MGKVDFKKSKSTKVDATDEEEGSSPIAVIKPPLKV